MVDNFYMFTLYKIIMEDAEFERLLKITRLRLTDEEKNRIRNDIEEIIGYFNKIDKIKVDEEPAYQPIEVPTRFRKDTISKFDDVEGLKRQSKLRDGYILGPKL